MRNNGEKRESALIKLGSLGYLGVGELLDQELYLMLIEMGYHWDGKRKCWVKESSCEDVINWDVS